MNRKKVSKLLVVVLSAALFCGAFPQKTKAQEMEAAIEDSEESEIIAVTTEWKKDFKGMYNRKIGISSDENWLCMFLDNDNGKHLGFGYFFGGTEYEKVLPNPSVNEMSPNNGPLGILYPMVYPTDAGLDLQAEQDFYNHKKYTISTYRPGSLTIDERTGKSFILVFFDQGIDDDYTYHYCVVKDGHHEINTDNSVPSLGWDGLNEMQIEGVVLLDDKDVDKVEIGEKEMFYIAGIGYEVKQHFTCSEEYGVYAIQFTTKTGKQGTSVLKIQNGEADFRYYDETAQTEDDIDFYDFEIIGTPSNGVTINKVLEGKYEDHMYFDYTSRTFKFKE